VSVTAEPAKGSRFGRLVGKIPLVRRLRKEPQAFTPPKPLKEVKPSISSRERGSLKGPVAVDVKVYITEAGKVDYAELLNDGGSRKLAADAVYAARRWNFAPAQIGGEKAPGEVVLHFKFEP
jgi:TonB family protein